MDGNGFMPRADAVDGELFIETAQTASATAALLRLLHAARQQPRPWLTPDGALRRPRVGQVHTGQAVRPRGPEVGRLRPAHERPGEHRLDGLDPRWLIANFGSCPAMCRPAVWADEPIVARALRESEDTHPTITKTMSRRPDRDPTCLAKPEWFS